MQDDMAAIIMIVRELFEMFPPGQQDKVDQVRANLEQLELKYAAGVAHWENLYDPEPGPAPVEE